MQIAYTVFNGCGRNIDISSLGLFDDRQFVQLWQFGAPFPTQSIWNLTNSRYEFITLNIITCYECRPAVSIIERRQVSETEAVNDRKLWPFNVQQKQHGAHANKSSLLQSYMDDLSENPFQTLSAASRQ